MSQTTAQLQTPPGRGGIAVILLAGPSAGRILADVFRPISTHARAGEAGLRLGRLADDRGVIDEAIVSAAPGGVEINIHGGPAAAQAALELLADRGAKVLPPEPAPAAAAEKTFARAHPRWHNPAIAAEMLEALRAALGLTAVAAVTQQWSGGISRLASQPDPPADDLRHAAENLATMRAVLKPAEVVIVGPPNAGKSTLANALAGRPVSIVHASAGTTRDPVREPALIAGLPVYLTDTAGIWDPPDEIDAEAVRRARRRARAADLVVLLAPGRQPKTPDWLHADGDAKKTLHVAAKCDALPPRGQVDLAVSAKTGQGLDLLAGEILTRLGLDRFDPAEPMAFTARQAGLLTQAADAKDQGDAPRLGQALQALLEG